MPNEESLSNYSIKYLKTETIVVGEATLVIEAPSQNKAIVGGYEQLGWEDWIVDTCTEIIEEPQNGR